MSTPDDKPAPMTVPELLFAARDRLCDAACDYSERTNEVSNQGGAEEVIVQRESTAAMCRAALDYAEVHNAIIRAGYSIAVDTDVRARIEGAK